MSASFLAAAAARARHSDVHVAIDDANDWPLDALNLAVPQGPNGRAVLLMTGAMNPAHRGHINMLHQARDRLERAGITVVGAFASPTHDEYVQGKAHDKGTIALTGEFRLAVIDHMVASDPSVTASPWEVRNDEFVDFPYVVPELTAALYANPRTRGILCVYVCGPDLGRRAVRHAGASAAWGGVVVVPRTDKKMTVAEDVARRVFVAEADPSTEGFSSTDLREEIANGNEDKVVEAMSAEGARFLLHPTHDEFARFTPTTPSSA